MNKKYDLTFLASISILKIFKKLQISNLARDQRVPL